MAGLLWTIASPTNANEWVKVGDGADGMVFEVREQDAASNTGQSELWTRRLAPDGSKTLSLIIIDCAGRKYDIIQTTSYSPKGVVIKSENFEKFGREWERIIPSSMVESMGYWVCAWE